MSIQLLSRRNAIINTSWDIVYEWEEDLSKTLQIPLNNNPQLLLSRIPKGRGKLYDLAIKFDNLLKDRNNRSSDFDFFFMMMIYDYFPVYPSNRHKAIPYIIDLFFDDTRLAYFESKFKKCPLVIISSIEAYNYLLKKNVSVNMKCLPLSLSDRHKLAKEHIKKDYDIIALGRTNPILISYLEQYLTENPEVEYIYQKDTLKGNLSYYSSKTGKIGEAYCRTDYLQILKKSKIGLYSPPGLDNSKKTYGLNCVTPKYLELLASQCHILARYEDTEETRFFGMDKISPHISDYKSFKEIMDKCLSQPVDLTLYSSILDKHYTSQRAIEIKSMLEKLY